MISAVDDVLNEEKGTRSLTLQVYHPGLIWTGAFSCLFQRLEVSLNYLSHVVIAFDAHVLEWNLDDHPPEEFARHRIKEASFYSLDTWTVHLVIKAHSVDDKLRVNYVGIQEKGMWPGKKAEKEGGGRAMKLFEELDQWLDVKSGGTVDATLLGCVGGITLI